MSVLLVEEHALVLAALRALIAATPGLTVIGEARTIEAAAEIAVRRRPDVILCDGRTPAWSAGPGAALLRQAAPDACVLVLADGALDAVGVPAEADACLPTDAGPDELCATVAALLGPHCANCSLRPFCPVPQLAVALSRRERQVAVGVAEGLSSKQIAAALGIGLRTVNTYRESLARKLGGSSAAVLTRFVLTTGLADARSL